MFSKQKTFFCFCIFFLFTSNLYALFFDRRATAPPSLTYFVFPIAGSIPGIQTFYGVAGGFSGIQGSNVDIGVFSIYGESNENFKEHGDGGNFRLNIFSVTDIPISALFIPKNDFLTLSVYYGRGRNVAFPQRARGIDSQKDDFAFILLNSFGFNGLELSTHFLEDQLEIYYTIAGGEADPLGFVPQGGKGEFIKNESANVSDRGEGGRYGVYLDDTDSRRDPRVGYRVQYERYDLPSTRGESPAYYQEDYNFTGFIPLSASKKKVLVVNQFYASATVTKNGVVDAANYDCDQLRLENCKQEEQNDRKEKAEAEAQLGSATSLGGVLRLRGYASGRFFDSYTNFQGLEFRWYFQEKERAFNFLNIERGVQTSWQLAFFYGQGTVAPTPASLWSNIKSSYGAGIRALFTAVVFRADVGFSEEGSETTVFFGYPF